MKDIIITVNKKTRKVKLNTDILGVVGENLQGQFIIDFDNELIDGACFLLCGKPDGESGYIAMTKDASKKIYTAPIKSSLLTQTGNIFLQVKITQNSIDDEIPIFKSVVFSMAVESAINAETVIPEEYPDWEEVANAKLAEIDKALEDVSALPKVSQQDKGKILEVDSTGEWVITDTLVKIKNELAEIKNKGLDKNYSITVTPASVGGSHCWEAVSAERYKCKISASEHTLVNPYIDDCIVYNTDGIGEKTILELVKTVTDDLLIYSNLEINCKIILKGD